MAGYNKVILIGRVVADPEMRYTPSGKPVANFTVAVDRNRTNPQGERETDFINIVTWQRLAEICSQYLTKGKLVAIDGRLQTRSYDTNDGRKVKIYEVVANHMQMLDRPPGGEGRREYAPAHAAEGKEAAAAAPTVVEPLDSGDSFYDVDLEDIPF